MIGEPIGQFGERPLLFPKEVVFDLTGVGFKLSVPGAFAASQVYPDQMLKNLSAPINFASLPQQPLTTATIFTVVENTAGYQHHPFIDHYDSKFWAMWSSGLVTEDQPGQRVMYATSPDGLNWSSASFIDPTSLVDRRFTAMGFWQREDEFYAVVCVDAVGVNPELRAYLWTGTEFDQDYIVLHENAITYHPFQQIEDGQWACWAADVNRDDYFMVGDIGGWTLKPVTPPANVVLSEPHFYTLPNGRMATLFRDNNNSMRLYRGESGDLWDSWSVSRTNFPDATSKSASLRLSDGRYVLVSNTKITGGSNQNVHGERNPLTMAVSDDGEAFDRMVVLRAEPTDCLYPSFAKNLGYQYPNLFEHNGYLWVIYSRNKEDIQVSRIAVADID